MTLKEFVKRANAICPHGTMGHFSKRVRERPSCWKELLKLAGLVK